MQSNLAYLTIENYKRHGSQIRYIFWLYPCMQKLLVLGRKTNKHAKFQIIADKKRKAETILFFG